MEFSREEHGKDIAEALALITSAERILAKLHIVGAEKPLAELHKSLRPYSPDKPKYLYIIECKEREGIFRVSRKEWDEEYYKRYNDGSIYVGRNMIAAANTHCFAERDVPEMVSEWIRTRGVWYEAMANEWAVKKRGIDALVRSMRSGYVEVVNGDEADQTLVSFDLKDATTNLYTDD